MRTYTEPLKALREYEVDTKQLLEMLKDLFRQILFSEDNVFMKGKRRKKVELKYCE